MKSSLIALALACVVPYAQAANDDIDKALRQIDAEEARVLQIQLESAKRDCDENDQCAMYKFYLAEAKRRLLKQRDK